MFPGVLSLLLLLLPPHPRTGTGGADFTPAAGIEPATLQHPASCQHSLPLTSTPIPTLRRYVPRSENTLAKHQLIWESLTGNATRVDASNDLPFGSRCKEPAVLLMQRRKKTKRGWLWVKSLNAAVLKRLKRKGLWKDTKPTPILKEFIQRSWKNLSKDSSHSITLKVSYYFYVF